MIDFKKPQEGIQELRYMDAMKVKYVRQQKKPKNDGSIIVPQAFTNQNPMDYTFPEIEEYFVYNPKMTYPAGPMQTKGSGSQSGGIKIAKDANHILHFWTSR